MKKDKYYTPRIEEFHVGFEYESEVMQSCGSSVSYIKEIITEDDNIKELYYPNEWYDFPRVKYLDKEDIEDLGFKLDFNKEDVRFSYVNFPFRLNHVPHRDEVCIYKWGDEEDRFFGTIKNKSELKILLKQLQV